MPKFFNTSTGQELTAGQALDVWLEYAKKLNDETPDHVNTHLFADAMDGYHISLLQKAGIEIKFGE